MDDAVIAGNDGMKAVDAGHAAENDIGFLGDLGWRGDNPGLFLGQRLGCRRIDVIYDQ